MSTLKAVRGTRDLLPPETELWNRVEATVRAVFARYGFGEIRTPVFEETALFARGVGEETDIVSKEMYTWEDRDRFDMKALKQKWLDIAGDEYFDFKDNVKLGEGEGNLIARRLGVREGVEIEVVELVEFKPEVKQFDIDRMSRLMERFDRSSWNVHIRGI